MRIKAIVEYKGTSYYGFQIQANEKERSIQKDIQDVLSKIFSKDIKIVASGRTDKGVHSLCQCFHFDVEKENIDVYRLKYSINSLLNDDIYIKELTIVDQNFHARFSVKSKTYRYVINLGEYSPFLNDLVYNFNRKLDIEKIKQASELFLGEHSFHNFCTNDEDFIRKIYDIVFQTKGDYLIIDIKGNGFRRYMVRMIIGILIQVGLGKEDCNSLKKYLGDSMNRVRYKAPSMGLYLYKIEY